jgi:hypothetical protein
MCVSLKYKNVRYDIYFHFRHQKLYCIRGNCPFVNYIYIFSYFRSWKYLLAEFILKSYMYRRNTSRVFENTTANSTRMQ